MAIRLEEIKPAIGSRVYCDPRNDLFTQESADLIRRKLSERTVLVTDSKHRLLECATLDSRQKDRNFVG